MVLNGLTIEASSEAVGPPVPIKSIKSFKDVTDAISGGAEVKRYDLSKGNMDPYLSDAERAFLSANGGAYVRVIHTSYRLCFAPYRLGAPDSAPAEGFFRHVDKYLFEPKTIYLLADTEGRGFDLQSAVTIKPDLQCGYKGKPDKNSSCVGNVVALD